MQFAHSRPPWLVTGERRQVDPELVLDGEHHRFLDGRSRPPHRRPGAPRPSLLPGQLPRLGILFIIILTILIIMIIIMIIILTILIMMIIMMIIILIIIIPSSSPLRRG